MRVLHLTEKDFKRGQWSGGSTTELFIWPKGADYATRRFSVRISSAKVDLEESDFTLLPNVTRFITPLSGSFTLTHLSGEPIVLMPLSKPYEFLGDLPTHCFGRATDLNLMLKDVNGDMTLCEGVWRLQRGLNCLYAVTDTTVDLTDKHFLKAGELLVVFADTAFTATSSKLAIACFAEIDI